MTDSLPAELTSFVGRGEQLTGIREQLERVRLVTLAGFGGCGKTRLALRIARERAAAGDTVWFVELGRVVAEDHVGAAVATVVGAADAGTASASDVIAQRLGAGTGTLLVIDNCEHVVDTVAELVATLLQRCPALTVLATSRDPLRVPGEVVWTVPPLPESQARQLFLDRAAEAGVDVPDDPELVAELCRRLDGIPLALELAAARVRTLGVPELAERLHDRFAVLTAGPRTAAPRQRTLRASLEWSHDLLTADEQLVLRRVSVCVGGFDTDMAQAVVGSDVREVAGVVADLADRSWLTLAADRPRARHVQLETVREFGLRQLAAADEVEATRDRHLAHVRALVLTVTSDDLRWRRRSHRALDADYGNITAALTWARHRDPAIGLELAAGLSIYWVVRGRYADGRSWVQSLLDHAGSRAPAEVRAQAQLACCWLSEMQADYAAELAAADAGLELAREVDDLRLTARLLTKRGFALAMSDYAGGMSALTEAMETAAQVGDDAEQIAASFFAGWYTLMHDGCEQSEELLTRAATGASGVLYAPPAVAVLGYCRLLQGRINEAADLLTRSSGLFAERGDRYWTSICLSLLGQLELARGDVVAAREHMESAVRQVDTLPSTAATAAVHLLRAAAMLADGQSADAAAVAEAALSGVADGWLGQGLRMLLVAVGGGHVPLVGDMPAVPAYTGAALVSIGERARAEGDAGSGADRARDALRVLVDAGIALYVPDALDLLARCTPEGDGAGRLRRASAALRRQMGTVPQRWLAPGVADEAAAAPAEDLPELDLADVLALATRGRGTRRRPPVGWESLTPAELAVVRLVADGDTNAQIAQRLFVSRRTVATHLEHVFTKLDVRTRAEVAAIAARQLP